MDKTCKGSEKTTTASRNTKQKALILKTLESMGKSHVTAEEIIDSLKQNGTPVAKSTVYRHLSQLEENGEIKKYLMVDGSSACYQFVGTNSTCMEHYHLMCKECGRIVHFENPGLEDMFREMKESSGFSIDGIRTVFYGICKECLTKEEEKLAK